MGLLGGKKMAWINHKGGECMMWVEEQKMKAEVGSIFFFLFKSDSGLEDRYSLLAHAIPCSCRKRLEGFLVIFQESRIVSRICLREPALRVILMRVRKVGGGVLGCLYREPNDGLRAKRKSA